MPRPAPAPSRLMNRISAIRQQRTKIRPLRDRFQMALIVIFYALAIVTIGSALITAFSRNIVHSAFALFGALAGVAGIYALLAADFLFIIQIFIYIGGILVVTIFAVMLTQGVAGVNASHRAVG